jgi:hypothetical protein
MFSTAPHIFSLSTFLAVSHFLVDNVVHSPTFAAPSHASHAPPSLTARRAWRAVYVVPEFQLQDGETQAPRNKTELLAMGDKVSQAVTGHKIERECTDYPRWRTAAEIYRVHYCPGYNPFFVANKRVPRYNTDFMEFGDIFQHGYEISAAGVLFLVLPDAFVVHVPGSGDAWRSIAQGWAARAPMTLITFMSDVQRRYGPAANRRRRVRVEALAGGAGENCTHVCERRGRSCRADLAPAINTCAHMKKAFGSRCKAVNEPAGASQGADCREGYYGYDLPAHNSDRGECLLNSLPVPVSDSDSGQAAQAYPTLCDVAYSKSARLCPCGERMAEWLTAEYVASTLSKEGGWGSRSPAPLAVAADSDAARALALAQGAGLRSSV